MAVFAVHKTQLTDPRLDAAIAVLRLGGKDSAAERSRVQQLTRDLDEIAWDIQDMAEAGTASPQDYFTAFERARAAASVGFALDPHALSAALEAVYEARFAVDDLAAVQEVVSRLLP
ncbi:MAG: hypothetical protein M3Z75_31535 [Actinomycetota bacterium]|nr:hypothetical protein [Actinomycetota bacterium]